MNALVKMFIVYVESTSFALVTIWRYIYVHPSQSELYTVMSFLSQGANPEQRS